jgi:hypothetical protein
MNRYSNKNEHVGLTPTDISILKYYKEGNELSGFEKDAKGKSVYENLCKLDYLDGDLELTRKAWDFIKTYSKWDEVSSYKNNVVVKIKPRLSEL